MSQVFQCPSCSSSFRVAPEHAGRLVGCPSCQASVQIPKNLSQTDATAPAASSQEIANCPQCKGEFRVAPELKNSTVACPHCNLSVQLGESTKKPANADLFAPGHQGNAKSNESKIKIRTGKKKSKKTPLIISPPKATDKTPTPVSDAPQSPGPGTTASLPTLSVSPKRESKKIESVAPPKPKRNVKTPPKINEPKQQIGNTASSKPPKNQTDSSDPATPPKKSSNSPPPSTDSGPSSPSVAHRLPPKFTAVDPDEMFAATAVEEHKIILPDGEGGFQRIDSRVVHVERDGKKVQLYSAPKEKKERRRFLQNILAILIGIIVLAAAFYLLLNW